MVFEPSHLLKPYVKHYWQFNSDSGVQQRLFPTGFTELAINISGSKVITILDNRRINMPRFEILGQLTKPAIIQTDPGATLLIVRFHPYSAGLFFSNPMSSFTDESLNLEEDWQDCAELESGIGCANSVGAQIALLEQYLIKQLKLNEQRIRKVQIVQRVLKHPAVSQSSPIKTIAKEFGVSERYLQLAFCELVGLTPKLLFQIQRFNRSLELIQNSTTSLTSVAYTCGYSDQSHFIKEFKAFSGLTPRQIRD